VFALQDALAFGRQYNPRLRAVLAAIDRAEGQAQVAFAPFLPQVDFLSHYGVTSPKLGPAAAGPTGIILASGEGTHSFAQEELQIQWTVCDFGRTAGRYHQAEARAHIAVLQSERATQTVDFDIATAYMRSLQTAALRVIQDEAIRRAEATLRDTRSRRAAGVAERDDVLRSEVLLAAAREDLDVAEEAELDAQARLNNFMGRKATAPLRIVDWQSQPAFNLSLVQCLEIAAGQRREIAIAREAIAAAQYGRQSVAAEFWPRVYALGSAGILGGVEVQNGSQEGVGLHIDIPIYAGGRRKGDLRAADADIREAAANAESILDNVTLEVTVAYRSVTTARKRIQRARPAVAEARENLRVVRQRYRNGHATPTDIVDAETALTRAQQRLTVATYEYLAALAGLDYALGSAQGNLLCAPPEETNSPARTPEMLPAPRPLPDER
jgi:outer membrane protein TolC